jgi:flagellar hook-length control protein FliK
LFMPFTDHYNASALNLLESKALAADRMVVDASTAPTPKEDFSKVFARVHKPREPERQDVAAQDKPKPNESDREARAASPADTREASDPHGKDKSAASTQAVSASARVQLMRLLRALQLTGEGLGSVTDPNAKALKAAKLSDSVSVITAGPAPTEAELLSYAKELGLSPDAITALMAQLQAEGLLKTPELVSIEAQLNSDSTAVGLEQSEVLSETQPLAAPMTVLDDATSRWLSLRGNAVSSSDALSTSAGSGQVATGFKADGSGLGHAPSDQSSSDAHSALNSPRGSEEALNKVEKLLGPGGLKEMLAGKAAERAMAGETMMKTALMKDLAAGPQGFETIDLSEFAAELSNPFDRPGLSAPVSASASAAGAMGIQASMTDSSGRGLGGEAAGRQEGSGGSARAFSAQLSQRFGEILGQRLLQQISQGNWKVELNLEPGDLGSIKIEMEFKKGELEASFKAGQAMTKDLLQDTLPRLREALERSGIPIASMNVGGDRQERSGDSLSQHHSPASGRRQPDSDEGVDVELEKPLAHRSHDGSLDVLV